MTRKIYVYPDELIEIRIVPEHSYGRNATSWEEQSVKHYHLVSFDRGQIAYGDPSTQFKCWHDE